MKEYRGLMIIERDEEEIPDLNSLAEDGWTVHSLGSCTRPGYSSVVVPYVLLERERR